jgi:hypothetical protein
VKRVLYLVTAALVALMILVPTAMAQDTMMKVEETRVVQTEGTMPLPKSGGPTAATAGGVLLPAAALLVGSGILVYAIVRRR